MLHQKLGIFNFQNNFTSTMPILTRSRQDFARAHQNWISTGIYFVTMVTN